MQRTKKGRAKTYNSDSLMIRSVTGILLIAIGILSLISVVGGVSGSVFLIIKRATQGLGGALCLGIPILFIWGGALIAFSAQRRVPVRAFLLLSLLYICVLGIFNLLSKIGTLTFMEYAAAYKNGASAITSTNGYGGFLSAGYQICAANGTFGGAVGMLTAWPLWTFVGSIGGTAILAAIGLMCVLFVSKFDVIGVIRQYRENAQQRTEAREAKMERHAYEKELKKQQRKQGYENTDETAHDNVVPVQTKIQAMQQAAKQETMQIAGQQGFSGFTGGIPAWPQNNASVQMGQQTQDAQQNMFVPGQQVTLYDEMIVPESPSNTNAPTWKLKNIFNRKEAAAPVEAAVAAPTTTFAPTGDKDREVNRVLEKMEENRKRKQEIEQRIGQASGAGINTPVTPTAQTVLSKAAKKTQPNRNMTQRQIDYANQTAAYQPPERPQTTQPVESPVKTAQQDLFAAYKKPDTTDRTHPMSGQRLDHPSLKLPEKRKTEIKESTQIKKHTDYPYPMIELLNLQTQSIPDTREQDETSARRLEKTLESFSIPARVKRVTHGPAVTRFELGLISSGINVKRILNIADNIALDMAANGGVRIEVPIPGTNLFGVEVPNKEIIGVSLAEVLTSPEMTNAKSPLSVALGKDIAGRPVICDLAKMPHLLIAGQTGSGKSVCINAIINSLLYRSTPEEVRMIMIDPKVVELQGYNKVPHLLIPVVSDPHKASGALAWAVQEMLDRYHKMQSKGVREITGYNARVTGDEPKLPRIVIIIDELSDLMLACKKEVEESIIRLAQLARAAGIHVVVATQRPTVNVITGLIKANIPSRIAFAVASSTDSRTILDMNAAEKLLGRGDMFYYPTGAKAPLRVQGCFVSDAEIANVVDYIGKNSEPDYDETINEIMESTQDGDEDDADTDNASDTDERLQEAIEMVLTDGQASISMLQRRMKIGYARAGRLIDTMATRGVVSKSAGSKPREILMSYEQYEQQQERLLR